MKLSRNKKVFIITLFVLILSIGFCLFVQNINSNNTNNISKVIMIKQNKVQKKVKKNIQEIIEDIKQQEEEAKKKAEEEAKQKAEAKKKAEEEAKQKAEAEKKAEEEAKRKAEAKKKANEKKKIEETSKKQNKKNNESINDKQTEKKEDSHNKQKCEIINSYDKQLLCYVNNARTDKGLKSLTLNTNLNRSANIRAKEIVNNFSHTRPNGTKYNTTITVSYKYSGENIAAGQKTAKQVFDEWMNSEGHRKNILSPNYKQMGIVLYNDSTTKYKYYWVQLFIG